MRWHLHPWSSRLLLASVSFCTILEAASAASACPVAGDASVGTALEFEANDGRPEPPLPSLAFTHRSRTTHFDLVSDEDVALSELGEVAEETNRRVGAWLVPSGPTDPASARVVRIYVCRSVDSLFVLERLHGLPESRAFHAQNPFQGRCYARANLIVIPVQALEAMRWQVVHEVTHTIFESIVGRNVEAINEGLAELVPWWILRSSASSPADLDCRYELYDQRLARAVLQRQVPSLSSFLRTDQRRFYDSRQDWLYYALSWRLAKVLVESQHPLVAGRFHSFLDVLRDNAALESMRAIYDTHTLEHLWRSAIDEASPWRPVFGSWTLTEDEGVRGSITGRATACVVAREQLVAGQKASLSYSVSREILQQNTAVGFVIEMRSESEFTYVEFRPQPRQVVVARRSNDMWGSTAVHELGTDDFAWRNRKTWYLQLDADPSGAFTLWIGDQGARVTGHLGQPLQGGSCGLLLESERTSAPDTITSVTFANPRLVTR